MAATKKIRVLIVEDSYVKRAVLSHILCSAEFFDIVKMVATGESAISYIKSNEVDIITMDINLPGMDGFDTAKNILAIKKIPIVIISAIRDKSNEYTLLKAMRENGALAFLDSPPALGSPDFEKSARKIIATLKTMGDTSFLNINAPLPFSTSILKTKFAFSETKIIAIGVSTGGPAVIEKILSALPANYPIPIVIVQHILRGFEEFLVNTLQKSSSIKIKVAQDKEYLRRGTVYISPSDKKISITKTQCIALTEYPEEVLILNTASHMLASVADSYGDKAVGIILTGMGRDGAKEIKLLRDLGAYTIAQDKATSAIFGMPAEAIRLGGAVDVMSPDQIVHRLIQIGEAVTLVSD
ncbi:MAG: chemotaxis protein CheB [Lentisphaerota bacterium]